MDEYVRRQYLQEEDFLEMYYGLVEAVLPQIGRDWRPNFQCNDQIRQRRDRLLAKGQLSVLTFDSAVCFHDAAGLSAIRIYLRSSSRLVVARIHWVDGQTEVEILAYTFPGGRHISADMGPSSSILGS